AAVADRYSPSRSSTSETQFPPRALAASDRDARVVNGAPENREGTSPAVGGVPGVARRAHPQGVAAAQRSGRNRNHCANAVGLAGDAQYPCLDASCRKREPSKGGLMMSTRQRKGRANAA